MSVISIALRQLSAQAAERKMAKLVIELIYALLGQ